MTVMARKGSSFEESLMALNQRLTTDGKAPVKIVDVPSALETEDLMEMAANNLITPWSPTTGSPIYGWA